MRYLSPHDRRTDTGPIQFYSEGARNANMTLMYELLGEKAKVGLGYAVQLLYFTMFVFLRSVLGVK